MIPSAVLKVGGSLSRRGELAPLCRTVADLAGRHRLLIVPGGAEFADQVRKAQRRHRLDEDAAHWMALLAMDQYGYVLQGMIPGSVLSDDPGVVCGAAERGVAGILAPAALLRRLDPLPHSWDVTSDTIAAWLAAHVHCRRLALLKDVDGLYGESGLIPEMKVTQAEKPRGGVDAALFPFLASISGSLDAWVINGLRPERLVELLDTGAALGTRISASEGDR